MTSRGCLQVTVIMNPYESGEIGKISPTAGSDLVMINGNLFTVGIDIGRICCVADACGIGAAYGT